jgi:hypothetical protein
MKRRATIEALLRWAYREQLPRVAAERGPIAGPRAPGNHIGAAAGLMALGSDGRVNSYGLLPSLAERDLPVHPDALAIGAAVLALADMEIETQGVDLLDGETLVLMPDAGEAGPDIAEIAAGLMAGANAAGMARACRDLPGLIRRAAILGLPDGRRRAELALRPLRGPNGRAAWFRRETWVSPVDGLTYEREADGYDATRKRPRPGAYRKWTIDGEPEALACARAEWQAWQAGLAALAEGLALEEFEVEPFAPDFWPWMRPPGVSACVLQAMGVEVEPARRVTVKAGPAAPAPRWKGRSVTEGGTWRVGEKREPGA